MTLESIWYEYSPYGYAVVGVVSSLNYQSVVSVISGITLLAASFTIFRMRRIYRKNKALQRERDERMKRTAKRKLRKPAAMLDDEDEF
jgi:heme O synthase-like polyprenyltransferase